MGAAKPTSATTALRAATNPPSTPCPLDSQKVCAEIPGTTELPGLRALTAGAAESASPGPNNQLRMPGQLPSGVWTR